MFPEFPALTDEASPRARRKASVQNSPIVTKRASRTSIKRTPPERKISSSRSTPPSSKRFRDDDGELPTDDDEPTSKKPAAAPPVAERRVSDACFEAVRMVRTP